MDALSKVLPNNFFPIQPSRGLNQKAGDSAAERVQLVSQHTGNAKDPGTFITPSPTSWTSCATEQLS